MKISIVTSVIIVVVTAILASLQGQRLGELKETRSTLEDRAITLGLPLEETRISKSTGGRSPNKPGIEAGGPGGTPTRDGSGDSQEDAVSFAHDLIEFAIKMQEWRKDGSEPPPERKKEMFALLDRFLNQAPETLPAVIDQIRATTKLSGDGKRELLSFSSMVLSQSSPETALNLYINSKDLVGEERMADHMVGGALRTWASQDPAAVMAWLDANEDQLAENAVEGARKLAVGHTFRTDPALGMRMALEMDHKDLIKLAGGLNRIVQDPQDQLALIRNLSGDFESLPDNLSGLDDDALANLSKEQIMQGGILVGLGQSLARGGFPNASDVLNDSTLTESQVDLIARGISDGAPELQDHGAWLNWINSNAHAERQRQATSQIVRQWTRNDFRSTAEWISEQPAGAVKNQATQSFAETVAPHEPDTAANWALTLPASNERTQLLETIHQHWSKKDAEAAAAFASEHGLRQSDGEPAPSHGIEE